MKRILIALLASLIVVSAVPAQTPPPPADKKAETKEPDKTEKKDEKKEEKKWDVDNPPGPHYDVPIDVTEGTWLSLDVSPDGNEIAFDLLGDIYTIPMTGGEAKSLTSGVAWDMQPRYSPNGKWIAFTSDRAGGDNIWIMNRDGSKPQQVTKETFRLLNEPCWTPDSEYLVARKHFTAERSLGAGEIWLYHRSGGEGLQLTKKRTDQKDTGEPALSPDGRYVYYSDDTTPGAIFAYNKDPNGQIFIIQRLDRQSGEIEPFVTGPGGSVRPTPSPDGKSLAFVRRVRYKTTLFILDLESGKETPITDILDRDMQETWSIHGLYPTFGWTPDNKSIVFWAGGHISRIDVATRAVTPIPFHVHSSRRIEEALRFPVEVVPATYPVKMLRWASASPNGKQVVYGALGYLYIRDLPTGTPHRLTKQSDHFEWYPAWSRDGKSIVYTTWNDQTLGTIRIAPATGGEGRVITDKPGHYLEPAFSPDGTKVVFRTTSDGELRSALWSRETGIYVVPAAGGKATRITKKGASPQFGASNDRVFFMTSEDEGKRGLHSIGIDRTDEREHLLSAFATEYALSPDEKWVAFREKFNAYIAPFIRTGKTIDIGPDTKSIPVAKVTKEAGEYLHWAGDGSRLYWSLGPELFSRDLKDSFAFIAGAPEKLPDAPATGTNIGFSQPADVPSGRLALTGARIITMHGDEVIPDGTVVIDRNRITAVGPRASTTVPADAKVIDVAGKTIMPGIVDVHWHGSMGADEIIPQQSWYNYAALAFGVTTLHDPSNNSSEIFTAAEMQRAGEIVGPHILHRNDPLRRQGTDQSRHRQPRRRALPPPAHESDRRDQRKELQPAAPRSAATSHRSSPPDRHDGRPRGGLAFRAQHDHGRRRAHRRGALHPGGQGVRRRGAALVEIAQRLHTDADRRLRRSVGRELLVCEDERLGRQASAELRAAPRDRFALTTPDDGAG